MEYSSGRLNVIKRAGTQPIFGGFLFFVVDKEIDYNIKIYMRKEELMKIIIIGNCGSGKSTLAKQITTQLDYPLLQLDSLWHQTNYSADAKKWFIQKQINFMQQNNWIIEGNYQSTMNLRLRQADTIIWLKINKFRAIWRIIKRSILFRINNKTRPEMPNQFSEHFDYEYWKFLKFVLSYDEKKVFELIKANRTNQSDLVIVKKQADKEKIVNLIKIEDEVV